MKVKEIINLVVMLFSLIAPLAFFVLTSPEEIQTQTYIIFGLIALFFLVGGFITYMFSRWNDMNRNLQKTNKDIEDIKKHLNFRMLWNKMDVRLQVLENLFLKKNKKAQVIDPRIIVWIILLILLYLFFRSVGFFK